MFRILIVIIVLQLVVACDDHDGRVKAEMPIVTYGLPRLNAKPEKFRDCAALQTWRDRKWNEWNRTNDQYNAWLSSGVGVPIPAYSGPDLTTTQTAWASTSTNNQEAAIDEPDRAKFLNGRIFFVRKVYEGAPSTYRVEVMRSDLVLVQSIEIQSRQRPRLFAIERRIAIATDVFKPTGSQTKISIFVDNGGQFGKWKELTFQGTYKDARLQGDQIFLVTSTSLGQADLGRLSTPCDQILESPVGDYSFDLTEIHTISVTDATVRSRGMVGKNDAMYMTTDDIYLFSSGYVWFNWDARLISDLMYDTSAVSRFNTATGEFAGTAGIDGWVHNQFSFGKSKDGRSLFIATTENRNGTTSRIWTLQIEGNGLRTVASTDGFGRGESLRSVRFIGDRAYVVTFLQRDPLFTFDTSEPRRVRMLSYFETPGFSAYLHPLENGKMLGAGYAADSLGVQTGLQFSVFDPSRAGEIKSLYRLEVGTRYSRVDVASDHHAFTYLKNLDVAALPVRMFGAKDALEFSGVLLLDLKNGISSVARWTHRDLIPPTCRSEIESSLWRTNAPESFDIQRVFEIPCGVVTLSPFGVKVYRSSPPWNEIASRKFDTTNVGPMPCLNTY